jgi:hypothetical protein
MLNMMTDSQLAYKAQFPAKLIGPFMPMYGRVSLEALETPGYVAGVYVSRTDNKWYFPAQDNWFGYMYRALLSVAKHYFYTRSAQAKTILDNWMAWLDVNILADGAYWYPPSDFNVDGTVGYSYRAVYAYATIAAACIFKYWVDGDAIALKWYRRLLDDIYARQRQTITGTLAGIYQTAEGSGYTTASVSFQITGAGAVAPVATPIIAGGKIIRYAIVSWGYNMTSCVATVNGDGAGAIGTAFMSNLLVGAFSTNPVGWEMAEIFNTYAMLVNGPPAGAVATFPTTAAANDTAAMVGLHTFYMNNARAGRPSMLTESLLPLHEFCVSDYHANSGIENPANRSSHTKGVSWTETIAPTFYMAIEWGRYSGDYAWMNRLYKLIKETTGS